MYLSFACFVFAMYIAPSRGVVNPLKCLNGMNCARLQQAQPMFSVQGFDVDVGRRFLTAATKWLDKNGALDHVGIYRTSQSAGCSGNAILPDVLAYFRNNPRNNSMPTTLESQKNRECFANQIRGARHVTSLIKTYIKDIEGGAIPISAANLRKLQKNSTCYRVKKIVDQIPEDHRSILKMLFEHLNAVVARVDTNLMNAANIGLVVGPNIFPHVPTKNARDLPTYELQNTVTSLFTDNPHFILDPSVTYCYTMPEPVPVGQPQSDPAQDSSSETMDETNIDPEMVQSSLNLNENSRSRAGSRVSSHGNSPGLVSQARSSDSGYRSQSRKTSPVGSDISHEPNSPSHRLIQADVHHPGEGDSSSDPLLPRRGASSNSGADDGQPIDSGHDETRDSLKDLRIRKPTLIALTRKESGVRNIMRENNKVGKLVDKFEHGRIKN